MTSDDLAFLDTLASLSSKVQQTILSAPDTINAGVEEASGHVRSVLESATWLPDFARPRPPPPPRTFTFPQKPAGLAGTIGHWASEHRAAIAAVAAFLGTGTFLYLRRQRQYARKRRARRSKSGARCEVVVVAGMLNTPVARSVILDLERRGYIVYVLTSNPPAEQDVKAEQKQDILPLHLDVTNSFDIENTISEFQTLLRTPQRSSNSSEPSELSLAGLIVIPDVTYPTGPAETIEYDMWSDEVNSKLLQSIATSQAFIKTLSDYHSRLLILTPSITSSLQPPFQSIESTIVSALQAFATSLRSELATVGVDVCQLHLGNFDWSALAAYGALAPDAGQEVMSWNSTARSMYAQNYLRGKEAFYGRNRSRRNQPKNRGSPPRELNNAVFDTLTSTHPWAVQRIGSGSVIYGVVGALTPAVLVRRMMGIQAVDVGTKSRRLSDTTQWEKVESH